MDPKPKKIMVDPDPPHGYCCKCGEPYWFVSSMGGSEKREPGFGITSPYSLRVCDECWRRIHAEIRENDDFLEYLGGWLDDLQELIENWPEGGSLPRFQDALFDAVQAQRNNLRKDPGKRGTPAVEARYALDREKVMML
jgi:hypothetical protein